MAFLLAWLLPNHYSPWLTAYQDFASFLAGLLIVTALLAHPIRLPSRIAFFFLLPLIPLLQHFAGLILFAGDAWIAALYLTGFALILLAGYNLTLIPIDRRFLAQLLASLFIGGAVLSLWISLRQWHGQSGVIWEAELPPNGRPFANFAQPNSLATLLCMGLVGTLYLYEIRRLGSWSASVLAAFLTFGVALTQSRTPWIGTLAVIVFWGWKAARCQTRLPLLPLLAWAGVYAAWVLVLPHISTLLLQPMESLAQRAQSLQRWDLWVQLWHAMLQGPAWGYGWNQVSVAQVGVSLSHPVPLMTEHSHNILLDLLLWNGPFLGGLIIFGITAWLLHLGWHVCTKESLFALLAVGFILVHALLEFPLEYAFFLFPTGLLLGMVTAELPTPGNTTNSFFRERSLPRGLLAGVLLAASGLLGWAWHEYRVIEEDHRLMTYELARIGDLKAKQAAPDVILLSQLRELIRFSRTPPTTHMSTAKLDWMRKVAHRYPYPFTLNRYAQALALNRQTAAAWEQLQVLRSLHGDRSYNEGLRAFLRIQHDLK